MMFVSYCLSYFRVDNNHLLLLMIHVFRENEEQLFKVKRDDSFFNCFERSYIFENMLICLCSAVTFTIE